MNSEEIIKRFLDFFKSRKHKVFPSSPLLDINDPSVLLSTAGMQQFKPYFTGELDPLEKIGTRRAVSVQKCFRTSDIEEVGDETHLTFFEMLGNFSFGDYFKQEAIEWARDFLVEECGVELSGLEISIFKGDGAIPKDEASRAVWLKLGIEEGRIKQAGRDDNFWGPTGGEGPCGPTTEIYLAGTEIWNIVFNEYYCTKNGKFKKLASRGIDTGMGLERIAMYLQGRSSIFQTDLFLPIVRDIIEHLPSEPAQLKVSLEDHFYHSSAPAGEYKRYLRHARIVADHLRGAVFLIAENIRPANVKEGYILRRIIRRLARSSQELGLKNEWLAKSLKTIEQKYSARYPELKNIAAKALRVIEEELKIFGKALRKGEGYVKSFIKAHPQAKIFPGRQAFFLYESYGFPLELTQQLAGKHGLKVNQKEFQVAQQEHQARSRSQRVVKRGGIREDPSSEEIRLHTATHLLHQALRDVLGEDVRQMGSDIEPERLRFDFSFATKPSPKQLAKIEEIVNQKISQDLPVSKKELPFQEAVKQGYLAFFKEKYPQKVSVYSIAGYSKEVCRGPHVSSTGQLGRFKIVKEESVGKGVRRLKAILE